MYHVPNVPQDQTILLFYLSVSDSRHVKIQCVIVLVLHVGASCAELRTATPVVHLGSMASASCLITEDCHLTKDPDFDVRFHYNNKLVEGPIPANTSSRAFQISISINVSEPRGFLTCSICRGYCQEVAGLEIRAGCKTFFGF